jgi:hypothetical protein
VIVHAGAPKPDINAVEALKQTLLRKRSRRNVQQHERRVLTTVLFPKLGIADQMKDKISTNGAAAVGRGEAEIGLQQVSEVLPVPNVDFIGTIPEAVQYVTTYAAAVIKSSSQIEASKRLIAFLSSPGAMAAIKKSGMEPSIRKCPLRRRSVRRRRVIPRALPLLRTRDGIMFKTSFIRVNRRLFADARVLQSTRAHTSALVKGRGQAFSLPDGAGKTRAGAVHERRLLPCPRADCELRRVHAAGMGRVDRDHGDAATRSADAGLNLPCRQFPGTAASAGGCPSRTGAGVD